MFRSSCRAAGKQARLFIVVVSIEDYICNVAFTYYRYDGGISLLPTT